MHLFKILLVGHKYCVCVCVCGGGVREELYIMWVVLKRKVWGGGGGGGEREREREKSYILCGWF